MKIQDWVKAAYENSKAHGWYEGVDAGDRTLIPEKLCLVHSELSEALEAYRDKDMGHVSPSGKPEGFSAEMADVIIRVFDLCGHLGIDLISEFGSVRTGDEFGDIMNMARDVARPKKDNQSIRLNIPNELCEIHSDVSDALRIYERPKSFNLRLGTLVWHCMILCAVFDVDLEAAVELKHAYNKNRSHRHGGKAC